VLLFSSETLSVLSLLHGCPFSPHFFPRISFPSDLWEVRDIVAIQHHSAEGLRRRFLLGRRSLMIGHVPLSLFGCALLCALSAAACGRAEARAVIVGSTNEPVSHLDSY